MCVLLTYINLLSHSSEQHFFFPLQCSCNIFFKIVCLNVLNRIPLAPLGALI